MAYRRCRPNEGISFHKAAQIAHGHSLPLARGCAPGARTVDIWTPIWNPLPIFWKKPTDLVGNETVLRIIMSEI